MRGENTALSQETILRNHALYQTSYIGVRPERTRSPASSARWRSFSPPRGRMKITNTVKHRTSRREGQRINDGLCKKKIVPVDDLDLRRESRATRVRPWQEKTPALKRSSHVQLFYEYTLPKDRKLAEMKLKTRKYVTNTKYGNIYEIRNDSRNKNEKTPPPLTYMWEGDFLLWSNGPRQRYLENNTGRDKLQGSPRPPTVRSIPSDRSTSRTTSRYSRTVSLPSARGTPRDTPRQDRPHPDIFGFYNSYRLEKQKKRESAILIQKTFRGWRIRKTIRRLKRKALLDHCRTWNKFVGEYRQTVARIQSRYGVMKTSCPLDLKQIETFMDDKMRYELAFRKIAFGEKLHKDGLHEYFKLCDLHPTEAEVNRSFSTVFRGSGNTAEVVFLLDCSTSVGTVGFHSLVRFVRDIVMGLDIAPDRARVGVIPFNEDIFNAFSITAFKTKTEVLGAISKIKVRHGLTRTDLALRLMLDMFMDARPGVQKIGIVISDGKSNDGERTDREAKAAHEAGVEMFAIGIGLDADTEELKRIASRPENAFFAFDSKSLVAIRNQVERRFCLASCVLCQTLLPRILREGLFVQEALEVVWTCFPPQGATISPLCPLRATALLDTQPQLMNRRYLCRPLNLSEVLDVVWTCYPPKACELGHLRFSRWIRPVIDGTEAWSLLDDKVLRTTNMKTCLRLVIQSKLERSGFIAIPSDVREGIEKVTNPDLALEILEEYMEKQNKLSSKGASH